MPMLALIFAYFHTLLLTLLVADNALKNSRCWTTCWFTFALSASTCCKSLFSKVLVRRLPIGECGIPLELRIILIFEFLAKLDFSSILTGSNALVSAACLASISSKLPSRYRFNLCFSEACTRSTLLEFLSGSVNFELVAKRISSEKDVLDIIEILAHWAHRQYRR